MSWLQARSQCEACRSQPISESHHCCFSLPLFGKKKWQSMKIQAWVARDILCQEVEDRKWSHCARSQERSSSLWSQCLYLSSLPFAPIKVLSALKNPAEESHLVFIHWFTKHVSKCMLFVRNCLATGTQGWMTHSLSSESLSTSQKTVVIFLWKKKSDKCLKCSSGKGSINYLNLNSI